MKGFLFFYFLTFFFIFIGIFILDFTLRPDKNSNNKKTKKQIPTNIDNNAENSTSVPENEKSQPSQHQQNLEIESKAEISSAKPILRFPSDSEIKTYLAKIDSWLELSNKSVKGHLYEYHIGYCLEQENYKVEYPGLKSAGGDGGIDIIARDNEFTWIIQCKNFQAGTKVPPKDIQAHYGVVELYRRRHARPDEKVLGAFFSNSGFSDQSQTDAGELNITLRHVELIFSSEQIRIWD